MTHTHDRYARQSILPHVGAAGQDQLSRSCALVVGAGALGSPVLQYLAGAGVSHLIIVDPDGVQLSNLHRQPLHDERQLGQLKVHSAVERLHTLNSTIRLTPHAVALSPDNAPDWVVQADVVLDCADSFAVSYTLSDECLRQSKPYISASVLGMSGYVGGFCQRAPSLRAVFPQIPAQATTCSEAGVMGPVAATLGSIQAQMALAVLLGQQPSPLGLMVSVDLSSYEFRRFRFDLAPEPDGVDYPFIGRASITPDDCVIDLRNTDESAELCVPHATRVLPDALSEWLHIHLAHAAPRTEQRLILACRSGLRAWRAADAIRADWLGDIYLMAVGESPTHP